MWRLTAKRKQIDAKTTEIVKQQQWLASADAALAMTKTAIKSAQLERGALLSAEVSETRQAWCADLTETATGTVATLEVPGRVGADPGSSPERRNLLPRMAQLVAREVQTPDTGILECRRAARLAKFRPATAGAP